MISYSRSNFVKTHITKMTFMKKRFFFLLWIVPSKKVVNKEQIIIKRQKNEFENRFYHLIPMYIIAYQNFNDKIVSPQKNIPSNPYLLT